jgi:3-oxoacyl-[acyl-carrier-protein] synthase II
LIDYALVGGSEAPLSQEIFSAFSCANLLSKQSETPQKAMKPFDKNRDGFVLGEGAVYLFIENADHAKRRDAGIYAEIAGFGETTDAYHPTSPHPGGIYIAHATDLALKEADVSCTDVQYVNLHGTATRMNDPIETAAMKHVFKNAVSAIPMSATKPITGHLLGACGALEAAITALAIQHQFLPPTINLEHCDEQCDLDYVSCTGRNAAISHAVSNNYSFNGRNASLVFKQFS